MSEEDEDNINTSLAQVMDLLAQEIERLKLALETHRLSEHPQKQALVRWHVQQIDARQDRLEEIQRLYLAQQGSPDEPPH